MKLSELFKSFSSSLQSPEPKSRDVHSLNNWYQDKYNNLSVQRNILLVIIIISFLIAVFSVIAVVQIANSKEFDPFVIQVEKSSGLVKVVNPMSLKAINADDAIARYFIKKYVIARETYNPADFGDFSKRILKLMSVGNIFRQYNAYINIPENNPANIYKDFTTTYLQVRSWSKIENNSYIFRFAIKEVGAGNRTYNKIAIVNFRYVSMELSEKDFDINPIGFQVTAYRIDDDNS